MSRRANFPANLRAIRNTAVTPKVLYEDNHLIGIQKPACMPSQGDDSGDLSAFDWVGEYIRHKYNKPGNVYVGLLHRLDRPVGGVLLMAKTSKAATRVSKMFQERKVEKEYLAVTNGTPSPPEGKLEHFLGQLPGKNIVKAYDKAHPNAKKAILHYKVLQRVGGLTLLQIRLETGRKHQIRVQLSRIGCGIVGDVKYAETEFLPDKSIALHGRRLALQHPVKKEERLELLADVPGTWPWDQFKI